MGIMFLYLFFFCYNHIVKVSKNKMTDSKFKNKSFSLRKNIKKRNQQKFTRSVNDSYDSALSILMINGKSKLNGTIKISGSKNASLPILFASILSDEKVTLHNVPNLSDVKITLDILQQLGVKILKHKESTIVLSAASLKNFKTCEKLVSSMRASVLMIGPLLTKFGYVEVAKPGGCSIGTRPIDLHIKSLEKMGAKVEYKDDCIVLVANNGLKGTTINLTFPSVGATENILMAATLAKGTTIIENAAKEPEIVDLVYMLKGMGAKITGEGSDTITIEGVTKLTGVKYSVCPDRIEAGSYLLAAAITRGNLTLEKVNCSHLENIIIPLTEIGCIITKISDTSINIKAPNTLKSKDVTTGVYPLFPTDLQPQWTTLMCLSKGTSVITETIFENRLSYVHELIKMGATIEFLDKSNIIKVTGVDSLNGTTVFPLDLRASFALVMAGLAAKGITTIYNLTFLDRGYENIINKLKECDINISRLNNLKEAGNFNCEDNLSYNNLT